MADAVTAAPHAYKVLLENDRVRVIEYRGGRNMPHTVYRRGHFHHTWLDEYFLRCDVHSTLMVGKLIVE